jgi:hypothetical protein
MNTQNEGKKNAIPKSFAILAGIATTTTASQAATVQITLTDNFVSSSGLASFNPDVTGDGVDDRLNGTYTPTPDYLRAILNIPIGIFTTGGDYVFMGNNRIGFAAREGVADSSNTLHLELSGQVPYSANVESYPPRVSLSGVVEFNFIDSRINDGQATMGFLDISVFVGGDVNAPGDTDARVSLNRLIFDDASTSLPSGVASGDAAYTEFAPVPEPSSLSLLALGAGGILARRRRKAA